MKLSDPTEASDPSVIESNRALQNLPLAVPSFGMPSHCGQTIQTQFLLVCEARSTTLTDGHWRFALEDNSGQLILDADDNDFGDLNRLTLLAAVRGLEAIDGPSTVTLLSTNRYLIRSLSKSLPRWRQNNFVWDHFGRRVAVQHADLWRRIDRALDIHTVQACLVSSCLVGRGSNDAGTKDAAITNRPETRQAFNEPQLRIDSPPTPSHRPSIVPAPSSRLRRLLAQDAVQSDSGTLTFDGPTARRHVTAKRRGRFTAEDLNAE
ncbi:ribonuclease HI [Stieleria sp. JC731]|uniref:ribonuclease HI n=1 Tax=Pirellulaceae TaxID=2691357 RepID=UPI001E39EE12|nr:ribonuclease HI [Stieleria sp. JC731]MCC9602086.1 ribonuclease HI [Stieleria sp. JC731]